MTALKKLRLDAEPDFSRRISAALADVEERRGNVAAARLAIAKAMDGEPNDALVRYFTHTDARLAAQLRETQHAD